MAWKTFDQRHGAKKIVMKIHECSYFVCLYVQIMHFSAKTRVKPKDCSDSEY